MKKALIAYFSASGVTAKVAKALAKAPEIPYTQAGLNWMDKRSRSSVKMNNHAFRPALANRDAKIKEYDMVFLGFPI